ncbi:MAG: PAS domain-containing protein [Proteobacteria bacterium]|nr:PAS domain-containing protein [Pseudomonadota bacterium]MBI3498875.1 PAS domain-containing protein [Pseudomonadota bacterium]
MSAIQWKLPETLQLLYDYWQSKRRSGALPRYADIDVAEIPLVLPHLVLIEPIGNGGDFRYLYSGSTLIDAVGVDNTGRLMSEGLPAGPYLDYLLGIHREVLTEGRPLFAESSFRGPLLSDRWTSRLILPTTGAGTAVGMLVLAQLVSQRSADSAARPYGQSADFEEGVRVLLE